MCAGRSGWPASPAPSATVGPSASRVSSSSVARSRSAGATAEKINPQSAASVALILSPSNNICFARVRPINRGSSQVAPESGLNPRAAKRLPKNRVVGGHGEVGGQREIAAQAGGESPHTADNRQMDAVHQLDHPIRGMGDAPEDVAGARFVVAAVGGDPVRTRAEVVAGALDVDNAQRVIGRGVGQRLSECRDHAPGQGVTACRPIDREPQDGAVATRGERAVDRCGFRILGHRRICPSQSIWIPLQ